MKILYVSGMYPNPTYPQKGIFCHEQVKALKELGIDVDVVVPMTIYDKEYPGKTWEFEGVRIHYVRYLKYPGVRFFEYTGEMLYLALMHSGLTFSQYDVFHADAPLPTGDALRRLSSKYKIPYIVHGHGLDVFLEESYKGSRNCKNIIDASVKVYNEASAVVGVSHKVLEQIERKVDICSKGYVVYNGVDTEKFHPVERNEDEKINMISVGNLIPLKGHEYTIKALKQLVDMGYKNIHLVLLGRGEQETYLKNLVDELELKEFVEMVGYVPYDKVVSYMQNSDIFVMPSDYEALGCVYLEAMACGLPAIGCKGNGIDEIIVHKQNGYLVEGKEPSQIVACIEDFFGKDIEQMKRCARKTVEDKYQWLHSAK